MKKLSLMIGIFCMALAMQACGDTSLFPIDINDPGDPGNNGGNGKGDTNELIGKMWQLQSFEVVGAGVMPVQTGQSYVLHFLNDKRIAGTAFCNGMEGNYVLGPNGTISMTPIIVTDAYCGPESREEDFIGGLGNAGSYELRGNQLRIISRNGINVLNFQQVSGGTVNGVPASIPELLGVGFKLVAFEMNSAMSNDRIQIPVPDDQAFSLSFTGNDRLSGMANCNTYDAEYTLGNASALTIDGLGTTKVGCGITGSMEDDFYYGLSNARQYAAWKDENGKSGLIVEFGDGALLFESE